MIEGQTGVRMILVKDEGVMDSWMNSCDEFVSGFSILVEKKKTLDSVESGDGENEQA